MENSSPFYYMLRASGHGEVWRDFTEEDKFRQYGWRCTTNEDAYSPATLIGNWSEKRFSLAIGSRRPLPSQFSHYFDTTYSSSYNKQGKPPIYCSSEKSRSFPSDQTQLDPPHTKCVPKSCYPLDFKKMFQEMINRNHEPLPKNSTTASQ